MLERRKDLVEAMYASLAGVRSRHNRTVRRTAPELSAIADLQPRNSISEWEHGMHEIRIDTVRNRIYITLIGFFSIEEATRCADETIEATGRLGSGCDVVSDVSQLKAATPAVAEQAERVQKHFHIFKPSVLDRA